PRWHARSRPTIPLPQCGRGLSCAVWGAPAEIARCAGRDADAAPPVGRAQRLRSAAALNRRERSRVVLHDERAVGGADRLGSGSRAVATECRAALEGDRVSDQLRALVTAGRAAALIRDRVVREVDRTVDVLIAAAHQLGGAPAVAITIGGAGRALL